MVVDQCSGEAVGGPLVVCGVVLCGVVILGVVVGGGVVFGRGVVVIHGGCTHGGSLEKYEKKATNPV